MARWRRIEACQSPVWDTVLAMIAPGRRRPARRPPRRWSGPGRWVLAEEIRGPGDWQVPPARPGAQRLGVSSSITTSTPTSTTPPR